MKITILPARVNGDIAAPPSKSSMQRACAAALIYEGRTIISSFGNSNDEKAALNIIQSAGAKIELKDGNLIIETNANWRSGMEGEREIHCGESGLSIRMFTPILALSSSKMKITGEGSLQMRPMNLFDEVLPQLKVFIQSNNGRLPLTIQGPLESQTIVVDGTLSSQFLTGLLFAFAKTCTIPVTINVNGLTSKPYIDLTLDVLTHFGFKIENHQYEKFTCYPVESTDRLIEYTVEGDWSNAAFLLVAGAIGGKVKLHGLSMKSSQGDKEILNAIRQSGALIKEEDGFVEVSSGDLKPFQFDATNCPDLFPPLTALAAYCNGLSVIKGVTRLFHKESDRAKALKEEFAKMNVRIDVKDDEMFIYGGEEVMGAEIHSHNDHRIAMAGAVAALRAKGSTHIEGAEAVNKSYPNFYKDLQKIIVQ